MQKKSLLVIEDDSNLRTSLKEMAQIEGYEVFEAENGLKALEVLKALPIQPGLIFLDMNMPVVDGSTFISLFQGTAYAGVPVVAMSAFRKKIPGEIVDFVEKPANPKKMMNLIRKYCASEERKK